MLYSCVLILVSLTLQDGTAAQSDWSGGSGVAGPVTSWSDSYYQGSFVDHSGPGISLMQGGCVPVCDSFEGANTVCAFDADGDGDIDVAGTSLYSEQLLWWENLDGAGYQWNAEVIDGTFPGARTIDAADIDGDGDMDLVTTTYQTFQPDHLTWWENSDGYGGQWIRHDVGTGLEGVRGAAAADVDGDGHTDLIVAHSIPATVMWCRNDNGDGSSWSSGIVDSNFYDASTVSAADLDGDGDQDILGTSNKGDMIAWWENTGDAPDPWMYHEIVRGFNGVVSAAASDIDGDGDLDVLGAASLADRLVWWENTDGTGLAWVEHSVSDDCDGIYHGLAADMDSDGDLDVVGALCLADRIIWWENNDGGGNRWTPHTISPDYDGALSLYITDINDDDIPDVMCAGLHQDMICWWDLSGVYSSSGWFESSVLDAGEMATWGIFLGYAQQPSGTEVSFQFRSSDDPSDMGEWSDTVRTIHTPLSGILADSTRFLQYRAMFTTLDGSVTPVLEQVNFSFVLVGVADEATEAVENWGLFIPDNPSFNDLTAMVTVPVSSGLSFQLFDGAGRVIRSGSLTVERGTHLIGFSGLSSGLYFLEVNAGEIVMTERAVVLR